MTVGAFLVMGYHPGLEDDAFYLAAIKRNLNPALFPHGADFFRLQFQATIFDKLIAASVRVMHVPLGWLNLDWVILAWQLAAIFLILHGCWRIGCRCFTSRPAQWGAVALVAALLTIPVSGTGINLADQYLHPRNLATALILAAVVDVLDRKLIRAAVLLAIAFSIHAIMASFGISLCFFLWWNLRAHSKRAAALSASVAPAMIVPLYLPLHWLFEPSSDAWRQAASTRSFYYVAHWQWYEWLGILAPLALLWAAQRWLKRRGLKQRTSSTPLPALASALVYYGLFQMLFGLLLMLPPALERLRPFEPMRYLQLLYLFLFLIIGGLLGEFLLQKHVYRWALLFIPLSAGMFYAQRAMYPATAHLELPGRASGNQWLQAFAWIRQNTPTDSLFALDPHYMELPGEDFHGFRALAERSVLADYVKDGGMAARVPPLAPRWLREVNAQQGWRNFGAPDFTRLKTEFGVNWIVLSKTDRAAASFGDSSHCPFANDQVLVCRLY